MEEASFVSKARTAFHSAAAKAERVFTDFKSDRGDSDKQSPVDLLNRAEVVYQKKSNNKKCDSESKHSSWTHVGTKQDWQDRFRNIKLGRKIVEDTEKSEDSAMAVPFYDENLYLLNMKNDLEAKVSEVIPSVESFIAASGKSVPPIYVLKQLAIAVEAGKKYKSMKDLLASSGDSSPARERSSLSLAAMKSLLLRDKEERFSTEYTKDDRVNLLIQSLFDADGNFLERNFGSGIEDITFTSLHKDIHGSPPQSLIVKISEVMGSFKAMRKMALFWCKAVTEMRQLWSEGQYIPCIPKDDIPDLHSCLLYQQFQVINCCLSRKRRRDIATESVDYVISKANSDAELAVSQVIDPVRPVLYARISTGELILRLGAAQPFNNLNMLETGEPVYSPITQEEPLLTEDVIKETEEFVLRTGSVGAGCSQLLSDMQAFKAANPGCILEDFVRWISPPDWTENERSSDAKDDTPSGDLRGQLSSRMQKEGNLWRELWETAKPMPAVRQAPLYDEDLAVEGILNYLEDILPSELFEQLFVSLVGLGLVIAESLLSHHSNFSKFFYECKDYVVASFQGGLWSEKVNDICEVYETVEAMLVNPDEVLKMFKQPETETGEISGETKRRFKRLSLKFGSNDKSSKKSTTQDSKNGQPFSTFFDRKSSLFSKKPPKPEIPTPAEKSPCPDENECEWTLV